MWRDLMYRLRELFQRACLECDLDDELRFHLERQIERYTNAGATAEESARRARLEFGALDQVKEDYRDARGTAFVETCIQDLAYAVRGLRRTPAVALTIVATVALARTLANCACAVSTFACAAAISSLVAPFLT